VVEMPTDENPVVVVEGDCLDVLPHLRGLTFTLVTDPPYGVELGTANNRTGDSRTHLLKRGYAVAPDTYEDFVSDVAPRLSAYVGEASRAAVFTGPHIHEQRKPSAIGGVYFPAAVGRTSWGFKTLLPVLFYGRSPHVGHRSIVLHSSAAAKGEDCEHPCPKPLEWVRWLVRLCTREGDLIVDPFAGSGTTGVAAIAEGRRAILVEKEPKYAGICRRRVAEAMGLGEGSLLKTLPAPSLFGESS
jgi:hypothetical protein